MIPNLMIFKFKVLYPDVSLVTEIPLFAIKSRGMPPFQRGNEL